jgi:two-component system chemotaxis response regulator CheB
MAPRSRHANRTAVVSRKRRPSGALFSRKSGTEVGGDLTDLGCPDCRGVLAVREEGRQGHLTFVCSIGHAYSGESLISSKEEQLENTLWSAVELYQEVAQLHHEMSERMRADGGRGIADAYHRRAKRATALASDLREMIGKDAPAGGEHGKH